MNIDKPTDPLVALDLAYPSIVRGMKLDEFVAESLVVPLAKVVLGVVLCQNSAEHYAARL